jgi:hypothetical protein
MSYADDLEKAINKKLKAIRNGTLPVKGCGVNDLISKLKTVDEAGAEQLQKDYIAAINTVTKKK